MNKWVKVLLLMIIAVIWMITIFKLSGMNSQNSNGKSTDIISLFIEDTLDITNEYGITSSHPSDEKLAKASNLINAPMRKVIHASVYFVLAFFIMTVVNVITDHKYYIATVLISLMICFIFAGSDEYHQTFVSGRTGQLMDVIIDSIGACVGVLFYTTYHVVYKFGYRRAIKEQEEYDNE